jgi:AcrR family transcriptional regulator
MNQSDAAAKPRGGRPRGFDRDQALDAAVRLFWTRGYEATSISDLTKAMGVSPPSLYGAFGDKKRLFLESVDRYQQGLGQLAQAALTEEPTAEAAVRRLLMGVVDLFADPSKPKGCLVVLGATNCAAESEDMFEALAARRRAAEAAVQARIAAGAEAGELAANADVGALADLVTGTLYGLAVKAKDGAPKRRLRASVDQLMRMWPRRESIEAATVLEARP